MPAPQVSPDVQFGITERADVLFDFSKFPAGTKIQLNNNYVGEGSDPGLGTVMQFTVQSGTAVPPPTLNPSLFPPRPVLTTNAPTRFKVLRVFDDERPDGDSCPDPALPNCNQRSLDGLEFSAPATEMPLVNSTEEWDLIHMMEPRQDDQDKNFHQIHIHLIEFQVLNRQPIDSMRYRQDWHLLNGHMPVTRPIVLDPTPYFTGPPQPPLPYETGWKDTVQAYPAMVNRIIVRWAPQDDANNTPGVNQFKTIDPTTFPDNVKGPGYVWHCHIVGHEDHDMLRQLALVNSWKAGTAYVAENVVEFNQVDYRARVNLTAVAGQTPHTRFDLWDRVNNNDGSWQPQIRYALDDRVTSNGQTYRALSVFQSQTGQTPANNPSLWRVLPSTFCGQFAQFCQGNSNPNAMQCLHDGQAGNEATCRAEVEPCLALLRSRRSSGPVVGSAIIRWCSVWRMEVTSSPAISAPALPASRPGRACSKVRAAASPLGSSSRSTAAWSRSTATGSIHCRPCGTTAIAFRSALAIIRTLLSRHGDPQTTVKATGATSRLVARAG